eukprot:jgi/Botrbrau1/17141/Bobra.0157s0038.2
MGAYLSHPVTHKETFGDSNEYLEYAGASMQGWRRTMEDAHIADIRIADGSDLCMFGVFDGHGGGEVAQFCQKYMAAELAKLQSEPQASVSESLVKVFHKMDEMLREECYNQELSDLKRQEVSGETGDGEKSINAGEALDLIRQLLTKPPGNDSPPVQEQEATCSSGPEPQNGRIETEGTSGSEMEKDTQVESPQATPNIRDPFAEAAGQVPASQEPGGTTGPSPFAAAPPAEDRGEAPGGFQNLVDLPEPRIAAGCTAIVAVLEGNRLYVANAGDSRAVLCRRNIAIALSTDHKPASDTERDRIHKAGGFISDVGGVSRVNGNLNLSRAIGDLRYKGNQLLKPADQIITAEPDIVKIELEEGDRFVVLACDGIWDVLSNQQAVQFVAERLDQQESLVSIASAILDHCLATDPRLSRGIGCDNMTLVIVKFKPAALLQETASGGSHSSSTTSMGGAEIRVVPDQATSPSS